MPYLVLNPTVAKAAPIVAIGQPRANYGKTLQIMRDELHLRLRNRVDVYDPDNPDYGMLDGFLNDAYLDVSTSTGFTEQNVSFSITTDIGQALYLLPEGILTVSGVTIYISTNPYRGYELGKITEETFRGNVERLDRQPLEFFEYDGGGSHMLVLWPTPDVAYNMAVVGVAEPAPLTDATDCPNIDRQFHEGIVLLARVKAHSALSEQTETAIAYNEFVAFMRRRTSKAEQRDTGRRPGSYIPRSKYDIRHRSLQGEDGY